MQNATHIAGAGKKTYHIEEKVDVRPFVHEKPHRMPIDRHFDGEIVRGTWLNGISWHSIVVRMNQRFIQIQY